ncbi:MAG: N-(5'-phosphoribosyl)anthranilate isomerase [Planctomycetota bacterium]
MSRVLVKICGLTRPDQIAAAVAAGADAIGLVLAASPRQVTPEGARALLAAVPAGVERIAVFRAPRSAELARIAALPFDGLQADAEWAGVRELPAGWFFLPVLRDGVDLEARARILAPAGVPLAAGLPDPRDGASDSFRGTFLVDGPAGGGQGIPVDIVRAARAARCGRLVLAGGLRPETVADAVRRVRPAAVDVSSGVETAPGIKDPARMADFVAAVRAADLRAAGAAKEDGR